MKKVWHITKKVLMVATVVAAIGLLGYSLIGAAHRESRLVCSGVQINIDYESGVSFLTTEQINTAINYLAGGNATGKPLTSFDLVAMERGLGQNPYIAHARLYLDHVQVLHADIIQKQPLLRIINSDGVSYYLSDKGDKLPLCDKFTPRVLLITGDVQTHEDVYGDSMVLEQLCTLGRYMQHDTLADALIEYMAVQPDGGLVLYPKFGGHEIQFGRADETTAAKMERLKTFYHEALTRRGWQTYRSIDLRYDGQVVGVKRDSTEIIAQTDN
jgi:cell division protein FtsQ